MWMPISKNKPNIKPKIKQPYQNPKALLRIIQLSKGKKSSLKIARKQKIRGQKENDWMSKNNKIDINIIFLFYVWDAVK